MISWLLKKAGRVFDHISLAFFILACILLVFIMLAISFDVLMRYFLTRPQAWALEVTSFSLVFITFLSATWLLKKGKHVKMDMMLNWLSLRNRSILFIITSTVSAITFLVIGWYGVQVTLDLLQRGVRESTVLQPLAAPLVAIVPAISFILFIQILREAHNLLTGGEWSSDKEQEPEQEL